MASSGTSTRPEVADPSTGDRETPCRRELDAQREEFGRELARKAYAIAKLERELHEVRQLYETSLSWRLTSPLRAVKGLLARRRG